MKKKIFLLVLCGLMIARTGIAITRSSLPAKNLNKEKKIKKLFN